MADLRQNIESLVLGRENPHFSRTERVRNGAPIHCGTFVPAAKSIICPIWEMGGAEIRLRV